MLLHEIWIVLVALLALPFACVGLVYAIFAFHYHPVDARWVLFCLSPAMAIIWASFLFVRLRRQKRLGSFLRWELLAFYIVTGGHAVWSTTWDFGYDYPHSGLGPTGLMVLFFAVPTLHLLRSLAARRQVTEPGAPANGGPAMPPRNPGVSEGPPSVS